MKYQQRSGCNNGKFFRFETKLADSDSHDNNLKDMNAILTDIHIRRKHPKNHTTEYKGIVPEYTMPLNSSENQKALKKTAGGIKFLIPRKEECLLDTNGMRIIYGFIMSVTGRTYSNRMVVIEDGVMDTLCGKLFVKDNKCYDYTNLKLGLMFHKKIGNDMFQITMLSVMHFDGLLKPPRRITGTKKGRKTKKKTEPKHTLLATTHMDEKTGILPHNSVVCGVVDNTTSHINKNIEILDTVLYTQDSSEYDISTYTEDMLDFLFGGV